MTEGPAVTPAELDTQRAILQAAADVAVRLAGDSPFPMPRGMLIVLVNSRTRKTAKGKRLDPGDRVCAPG